MFQSELNCAPGPPAEAATRGVKQPRGPGVLEHPDPAPYAVRAVGDEELRVEPLHEVDGERVDDGARLVVESVRLAADEGEDACMQSLLTIRSLNGAWDDAAEHNSFFCKSEVPDLMDLVKYRVTHHVDSNLQLK